LLHADTWKVLEQNVKRGVLRSIGVSNFNKKQMQELFQVASIKPAVNRVHYNIFSRDEEAIAFCHENNITVEAQSPLVEAAEKSLAKSVMTEPTVKGIAKAHNISPAQVGLRWIVQRGDAVSIASTNAVPAEYADLWSFALSANEMSKLDNLAASVVVVV